MVSDMLNEVLQKEKQTAENEQKAKLAADKTVLDAEAEAEKLIADAKAQAEETATKLIAEAKAAAEADINKAGSEAEKLCESLKASGEAKLGETIDAVKAVILK